MLVALVLMFKVPVPPVVVPDTVNVAPLAPPNVRLGLVAVGSVANESCGAPKNSDTEASAVDISLFCHDRLGVLIVFIFWLRVLILLIFKYIISPLFHYLNEFFTISARTKCHVYVFFIHSN